MKLINPIDKSVFDLAQIPSFKDNKNLQDTLQQKPYFALRFGQLSILGNKKDDWNQWDVKKVMYKISFTLWRYRYDTCYENGKKRRCSCLSTYF